MWEQRSESVLTEKDSALAGFGSCYSPGSDFFVGESALKSAENHCDNCLVDKRFGYDAGLFCQKNGHLCVIILHRIVRIQATGIPQSYATMGKSRLNNSLVRFPGGQFL